MSQTALPYYFFRGGSSRGPYFKLNDLPADRDSIADILLSALGSGHPLNIDGIGGGNAVTTKVAILSVSQDEWADVDYLFAQVGVEKREVDFKPTCGNLMIGVGPAAIEMGLVQASDNQTKVNIKAVNTGATVVSTVQTPGKQVTYEGDCTIDGVPGSAAPVSLDFTNVAGAGTGELLPTGHTRDTINKIEVSCVDFAMPMVIAKAEDFGITGYESREDLDSNKALFHQIEAVRLEAARAMGMGDCSQSVTPKFGLISTAKKGGLMNVRYFMPWSTHPTLAVTGAQCLAACTVLKDSVAADIVKAPEVSPSKITLEHPMGSIDVNLKWTSPDDPVPVSAGLVRTARKLAQGSLFVPSSVWGGF